MNQIVEKKVKKRGGSSMEPTFPTIIIIRFKFGSNWIHPIPSFLSRWNPFSTPCEPREFLLVDYQIVVISRWMD